MAVTRARTTTTRTLGLVTEADTGVYVAPVADDAQMLVMDPSIVYDKTLESIRAQGSAAPTRSVPGLKTGKVEFTALMQNSGTAGIMPVWAKALLAAGFKGTGTNSKTFVPLTPTDLGNTSTVAMWTDGRMRSLSGCAFTFTITGEVGKPAKIKFEGLGVRKQDVADVTQVVGAAPAVVPPILVNASLQINAVARCVPGFEISGGGRVVLRKCANDTTGILAAQFIPETASLKITPDAGLLSDINWFTEYQNAEQRAFTVTIGSTANNRVVITAPALQLIGDPEEADEEGLMRDALEFQLNATAAGNDYLQIALT